MKKLWNWLMGTRMIWIETEVGDRIAMTKRKLHIHPFDGVYVWRYPSIKDGRIFLLPNGKGKAEVSYVKLLRWITHHHRPLRPKYMQALIMGEMTKKWEGDK